jgi:N-acetylmuramoyl-L-alanine amidase
VNPIRVRLAALSLPLLLALAPADGQAPPSRSAAPLTVVTTAGRTSLAVVATADHEMIALGDLASLFPVAIREDAAAGGVTLSCKGRTVALTPGQNVASVAGRLVSLPVPVARDGRRWLVPVEFLGRALASACDTRIELRAGSRLVVVGDARVPRISVTVDGTAGSARVSFELTPRAGHAVVQDTGRLLVRFETDAIDAAVTATTVPGLVQAVRVIDPANLMAIELGPRFGSYRTSAQPTDAGGERFVVDIVASATESIPLAQVAVPPQPQPPPAAAPDAVPATIVIDPGHGGDEPGARGPGGTVEKDVTLGVARQLKNAIESRLGVRVLLTRDADQTVAPDDRTALADNNKAAMFVSLHANSSLRPDVRGATVFYLDAEAETPDQPSGRGAILPTLGGGAREIDVVPWDLAQTRFVTESASLGAITSEELKSRAEVSPRPVERAPLRVLVGANMPAVLVELGYLSNAEQEKQLTAAAYQGQLVQALLEAVSRFRTHLDQARQTIGLPTPTPRGGGRRMP